MAGDRPRNVAPAVADFTASAGDFHIVCCICAQRPCDRSWWADTRSGMLFARGRAAFWACPEGNRPFCDGHHSRD